MYKLVLEGLSKNFKEKKAVDSLSLSLSHGVYGLLGENGAGKTTLMRMICGLLQKSSGRILCDGVEIEKMGSSYRRLLGYLPQDFGYYPDYSAQRFLMYLAALKALPDAYARQRVSELLELVNLSHVKDQKLKTFSGGMLKRIGIAQALLNEPKILILDEPTSGLDPKERIRFRNIISSLGKDRIVLLSTHIVSDIEYIADHIVMMQKGKMAACGTVEEILLPVKQSVWECQVSQKTSEILEKNCLISNLKNAEPGVLLRIVSDTIPTANAVHVPPTLEDAYLYYLSAEQNTDTAITAEQKGNKA